MRRAANDDFREACAVSSGDFLVRAADEAGVRLAAHSLEAAVAALLEHADPAAQQGDLTVIVTEAESGLEQAFLVDLRPA